MKPVTDDEVKAAVAELIGGPGWRKGVLDCIDALFVRQANGQADFTDAIKQLQALYDRDAKPR